MKAVIGAVVWSSCLGAKSVVAAEKGAKMQFQETSLGTAASRGKMHHRPFDLLFGPPVYEERDLHEMQLAPKQTRKTNTREQQKTNREQDNVADQLVKRLLHVDAALARHLKEGRIKDGGEGAPICAGHHAV